MKPLTIDELRATASTPGSQSKLRIIDIARQEYGPDPIQAIVALMGCIAVIATMTEQPGATMRAAVSAMAVMVDEVLSAQNSHNEGS